MHARFLLSLAPFEFLSAFLLLEQVCTLCIVFYLGANSRAYSMLDELRVVNFAIVKSGAAYTPTVVPYDTNSVLVLPDGAFPIADEYWEWDKTIRPFRAYDFTAVKSSDVRDGTYNSNSQNYMFRPYSNYGYYRTVASAFSVMDGFCHIASQVGAATSFSLWQVGSNYENSNGDFWVVPNAPYLILPLIGINQNSTGPAITGTYTVSVVLLDGSIYSDTVNVGSEISSAVSLGPLTAYFVYKYHSRNGYKCYGQVLALEGTADIVYLEICKGSQANTGHKKVSAIYSSDELQPNTAAIQSDIPVQGYTVGGVRPTFPVRGDVWMPVEGSRITGVQIYNGRAWEETNARYWTGKRWIPIYAFDLVTLQDMWDVTSSTGEDVSPPISSEYGFWNWWQKQWLDFRAWLEKSGGTGTGPGTIYPDQTTCEHTHVERVLTQPTCTTTGTGLYVCTNCHGNIFCIFFACL